MHLASLPDSVEPQAFWRDYYAPLMGLPRALLRRVYLASPVHRAALRAFPDRGLVVDAGCGMGVLAAIHDDPRRAIVGVDEVEPLLRIARVLAPRDTFVKGTLDRLPLEGGSADLYVAISAIECTTIGLAPSLREAYRVLAPGGRLFAACLRLPLDARHLARGELESTLGRLRIERIDALPETRPERAVAIYYSKRELRAALEAAGFRGVRIEKSDLFGGLTYARLTTPLRPSMLRWLERVIGGAEDAARTPHASLDFVREDGPTFARARVFLEPLRSAFAYWNVLIAHKP